MRWNCPPIAPASDFTASVFASPGTPSTSRWPPDEQADRHPLEQDVLPDDRALDLEQHLLERVRGLVPAELAPPVPSAATSRRSYLRPAPAPGPPPPSAAPIGTAKAMPANASSPAGSAMDTTMPMTSPLASSSGPPELPGFTDASNWISPENLPRVGLGGAVQARDHAGGDAVGQPERVADRDDLAADRRRAPPIVAGTTGCGSVAGVSVAMSVFGSADATVRRRLGAVGEQHGDRAAVGDDVVRGDDRAGVGRDHAGAQRARASAPPPPTGRPACRCR